MAGRKRFCPTDQERKQVEALSGYGISTENIAALIRDGIDNETLVKYFKVELSKGKAKANSKVAQSLFNKCTVDMDTTSIIWWTKTQMRWREVKEVDMRSSDGSMTPRPAVKIEKLSIDVAEAAKEYQRFVDGK